MGSQAESSSPLAYEFAEYRLEPARRSLTREGTALSITGKPFDVLLCLVQHAGEVVDRDTLMRAVWPKRVVEENNINQIVAGLRRTLGPEHIVTVAGRGYQFATPVRQVMSEQAAEPWSGRPELPNAPRAAALPVRRKLGYALIAVFAFLAGWIAVDAYRQPPAGGTTGRIAVLPCDNLSPVPADSYFAVALHAELLNRLTQVRGLRVKTRSAVMRYADDRPPIPQIGSELGVETVMECGVRYDSDEVVLTAQLIDAATDEYLWSRSYAADLNDLHSLYEIQADIAVDIARTLHVRLADEESDRIRRPPTESRDAHDFYSMAVALGTRDRARQIELLDRALEADPQFVDAWIRKSAQHAFLAGITTGDESARHSAEAQAAIDYALELKPDSPYAHAVRATQLGQAGEWIDSELEWRHAFALDVRAGNDALLQLAVGNVAYAAAELEDVLIDDPKNDGARSLLLLAYTVLDDKDKRRWHWRRGEELHGSWMGDAIEPGLRLMEGDREFVLSTTDHRHSAQARIWHAGKDNLDSPEDGLAAMRALRDEPELRNAMNLRAMATWALYFGNTELGLAWFSESVELEATGMMSAWLPGFAELRREPGFKDLLRSQGLPEYWNRFEKWPTAFCRPTTGDDFECE